MNQELRNICDSILKNRGKSDKDFLQDIKKLFAKDRFFDAKNIADFFPLMKTIADAAVCTFDTFLEVLITFYLKARTVNKKLIPPDFAALVRYSIDSPLLVDKKSREKVITDIRDHCIRSFNNNTATMGKSVVLIEKTLKYLALSKENAKLIRLYSMVNWERDPKKTGEFQLQCLQATMGIAIQNMVTKFDSMKLKELQLHDEFSLFECMLTDNQRLYVVMVYSIINLLNSLSDQDPNFQKIFKAIQLLILQFLTQQRLKFEEWWIGEADQTQTILELIKTFKTKIQYTDNKAPRLMPDYFHLNLISNAMLYSNNLWNYLIKFNMPFSQQEVQLQCIVIKNRVGILKPLYKYMDRNTDLLSNPVNQDTIDRLLSMKSKDYYHIYLKILMILHLRVINREKDLFRDRKFSQIQDIIPYLGVFSLELLAFSQTRIADINEVEDICYKFHLYDKKAHLNQSLFELIKNQIVQCWRHPNNNQQLQITVALIKRTIEKFKNQTVIFSSNFPLMVKSFYNDCLDNLLKGEQYKNDSPLVKQIFLLIFAASMNKYTFVALIQSILQGKQKATQMRALTTQQEALCNEIGVLGEGFKNLSVQDNKEDLQIEFNKIIMSVFMLENVQKPTQTLKKLRSGFEDGRAILDLRFDGFDFNFQQSYKKHARVAFQYFFQDNGFTINTYLSLVTSYEDTDIAYQKIISKRSKFIEFFRGTLYNREEFLQYLSIVVDRKQGQESDSIHVLPRLYIMQFCYEMRAGSPLNREKLQVILSLLSQTIFPSRFKLLVGRLPELSETSVRRITLILNQWVNVSFLNQESKTFESLQKRLNLVLFDELLTLGQDFHNLKKLFIS